MVKKMDELIIELKEFHSQRKYPDDRIKIYFQNIFFSTLRMKNITEFKREK